MSISLINSTSGMRALQVKIDNIGNNIANINTMGFKGRDVTFSSLLTEQVNNEPDPKQETGRLTPDGIRVGYGTREALTQFDFAQGSTITTDNPTDFMIEGRGFFQVQRGGQGGQGGQTLFTRDGSFALVPVPGGGSASENTLRLVTANGDVVLDDQGQPIDLPSNINQERAQIQVDSQGNIRYTDKNNPNNIVDTGQRLAVVRVSNEAMLQAEGDNLFAISPNLPNPPEVTLADDARIVQGALESSNVDIRKEMTELLTAQRAFQFNARALSYSDQMLDIANRIIRG